MKIFKPCLFLLPAFIFIACKPQQTAPVEVKKETVAVTTENLSTPQIAVIKKDSAYTVLAIDRIKKTIYRGVKNPLTIIVPGAVSTKVEANGLMKVDNYGHYDIRPGTGTKADIKITAVMPDGSTFTETRSLNIKNLPNPKSYLAGVKTSSGSGLVLTEEEIQKATVALMIDEFDYDIDFIVTGFDVLFPNGKKIKVEGDKFDAKALEMLKKVKNNGQIKIHNIVAHSSENPSLFRPDPIVVKLKVNKKARPKK